MTEQEKALLAAWSDHSRAWKGNSWVYPVISRRAGGLSVGVNLNPDHRCSFSCAYCQSGPQDGHPSIPVDVGAIERELRQFLEAYDSGEFAESAPFARVPAEKKILKDICLSGDGESTIVKEFPEVCKVMRKLQKERSDFKLRLITNASRLGSDSVEAALAYLMEGDGEIWAKLDAGTEPWFKRINRSALHLDTILRNLETAIRRYPICIQTMLCSLQGDVPGDSELDAYVANVVRIYEARPENFVEVQLYTVIRDTAMPDVHPLPREFLEATAAKITAAVPVNVRVF